MSHHVVAFIEGNISASTFISYLRGHDVRVDGEIDQLIRNHEADNSGKFSDFVSAILRNSPQCGKSDSEDDCNFFRFEGKEMTWDVPATSRNRKNCNSDPHILSWSCMYFSCV